MLFKACTGGAVYCHKIRIFLQSLFRFGANSACVLHFNITMLINFIIQFFPKGVKFMSIISLVSH